MLDSKTQTRRLRGLQNLNNDLAKDDVSKIKFNKEHQKWYFYHKTGGKVPFFIATCPYGVPGHKLYVKQRWRTFEQPDGLDGILYVDNSFVPIQPTQDDSDKWLELNDNGKHGDNFRPAMFMPARWALIHIELTDVSVERVTDITTEDVLAEGLPGVNHRFQYWREETISQFATLWNKINGETSPWSKSDWVWKLSFKRVTL